MLQRFNPYRPITIFVLVLSYVWIVFQYPIQEALHMIVHMPDMQQETFIFHSHDNDDTGHFHRNLQLLEEVADSNNAEDSPQTDLEIKKKIEIVDFAQALKQDSPLATPTVAFYLFPFSSPFLNVNSPPPRQC